jgi:hypothetical protein
MRFIADTMLGRLAKWLRFLGYDTLYFRKGDDVPLLEIASQEGRILLTRDRHLLERRLPLKALFVRSDHLHEQLQQVIEELNLPIEEEMGTRCMQCNVLIEEAEPAGIQGLIPDFVFRTQEAFYRCPICLRIYWAGSHFRRMEETLRKLCA